MFNKLNISIFWFEEINLLNPRSSARHACIPTQEENLTMSQGKCQADKRAKEFGMQPNGNWQDLSGIHAIREYLDRNERRLVVLDAFPY